MHIPPHFNRDDPAALRAAMRRFQTATLVSQGPNGMIATHVPVMILDDPAPLGRLRCHFARANTHANLIAEASEVLAIFQGPEGYISPNWYPSKPASGKVVPTWNYATVHAYSTATTFHDAAPLKQLVTKLTDRFETQQADPWSVDDAPADFIDHMLKAIVGIDMTFSRLEGKWKMSQNRPAGDQAGVIDGLRAQGGGADLALAAEMKNDAS